MVIPEQYIIQKFYQHAGYPKYVRSTNTYMGGCPICREGNSWKRKSRCYYIPKTTSICCHNCGYYNKPVNWIMEVEGIQFKEVVAQIESGEYEYGIQEDTQTVYRPTSDLPVDSINLFDRTQLAYYKDNPVVKRSCEMILNRKLNKAINKPKALYTSLNDYTHKERLIIPFYDKNNKCVFYQSRKIYDHDHRPKYLSKVNSEKTLFNYDNVESSADQVFITEGPIDSFFIKNSVAVAGIQEKSRQLFSPEQQRQIDRLFLMQPVWVLDSQWLDQASRLKSEILLKQNLCVFIWPRDTGMRFKDVNEMCMYFKINQISPDYITKNTYCGIKGIVKINQIR